MKDPALITAQGFSWEERQMMEERQTVHFSAPENGLFLMRHFIHLGNDLDNRGFFIAECVRQVVGRAASSQVRRLNRGEKR